MPQVKDKALVKNLIRKALKLHEGKNLKEAELSAGTENTKFSIKVDVSNPQSETKLGVRIQLTPKEGMLEPDVRDKLEATIMKKLNNSLEQYDIQVSKDTDVPNPEVLGFFIPLSQIKNMIVSSIKGPSEDKPVNPQPKPTPSTEPQAPPSPPVKGKELNEVMRQRTLNEISSVIIKEDFYGFINAGNNMLRTLEEKGYDMRESKKYLEYLVKNNIM